MKVSLVVATGVHQGKVIPILGPQFLVGRDPQCQLRPASQAVSKQHCAIIVRDGKVYLRDFGSTNGTVVNDAIVRGEELEVENNDLLKIGPLDFTLRVEATAPTADGTPLPGMNPEASAALAAVKAAAGAGGPASKNATPNPGVARPAAKPGSKEVPLLSGSKEAAALAAKKALPPDLSGDTVVGEDVNDKLAAMLLGLDDGPAEVPEGNTAVEMPTVNPGDPSASGDDKKDPKKAPPTREDTSSAASEILRKYMRRPK